MAEDSDLEKTEAPTGRRIEQAREQGQVPHSRELGSFLVLIVSAGTVWFLGGWFVQRLSLVFRKGLVWDRRAVDDPEYALTRFSALSWDAVVAFWPLILALVLAALASPFLLNAWNFAPKAFTTDLTRLNPLNGIKRVFSWNGLVEMVKAVAKAGLIGGVAVWVIWREQDQLFQLLSLPLDAGLAMAGDMISWSFLLIVAAMFLIVAAEMNRAVSMLIPAASVAAAKGTDQIPGCEKTWVIQAGRVAVGDAKICNRLGENVQHPFPVTDGHRMRTAAGEDDIVLPRVNVD